MEEKEEQYKKGIESYLSELNIKLQEREREVYILEEKFKLVESLQLEILIVFRLVKNVVVYIE